MMLLVSMTSSFASAQLGPVGPVGPGEADFSRQFTPQASPAISTPQTSDAFNPLNMLNDAGSAINGASSLGSNIQGNPSSSSNSEQSGLSVTLNIMLLLTVIALVPSIMLMTTSFVRIMVVLALLRQAMGTQSLPPGQVITGLALFMTALVMKPTIDRIWADAVVPYQAGEVRNMDELWVRASTPMRDFMFDQIEAADNWSSLYMILNYQGVDTSEPESMTRADISTTTLIPAYMLSELKVSFLMGFRVYLPFLVIDMVIASLLISMSMMMLPPVLISLPFKLMLFVLVDGWTLIVGSLLESFVQDGDSSRLSATAVATLAPMLLMVRIKKSEDPPLVDRPARKRMMFGGRRT